MTTRHGARSGLWTYFDMLNLKQDIVSSVLLDSNGADGNKHSINLSDTEPMQDIRHQSLLEIWEYNQYVSCEGRMVRSRHHRTRIHPVTLQSSIRADSSRFKWESAT
jgi:hypothetical protein